MASSTAQPAGTKSGLFVCLSPPLLHLRVAMGRPPDGLSAHYIRNRKLARAWSTGGRARVAKCHGRRAEGPRTALLLTLRSPSRRRIPGMASAAGCKREGMNRAVDAAWTPTAAAWGMPTRALTTMSVTMLLRPAHPRPYAHDRPEAPRRRRAHAVRRTSRPPPSSGDGRHRNGRAGVERHPQYPARRDHHAGEPLVRQLLWHVPRRGRHPDAGRCAHRLRARPEVEHVREALPRPEGQECGRPARGEERYG